MKNGFIYLLAASLLFSYNSIGNYEYHKERSSLEYLLNERIVIMNDFLYGEKDMVKLEDRLDNIEAEELLENDLDILYKVIDSPTDYELAMNVEIDKINSLIKSGEKISLNADLKWLISGYDGEYDMIKNYDISCVERDNNMYITSLKYIEQE